jgi:hypothetical protein
MQRGDMTSAHQRMMSRVPLGVRQAECLGALTIQILWLVAERVLLSTSPLEMLLCIVFIPMPPQSPPIFQVVLRGMSYIQQ